MKKLLLVLSLIFGLCTGASSVGYAAQIPVVCLTEQEQFEYYKDCDETTKVKHLALTQFAGMAQGDTRTQTIRLQNRSEHQANFYITEATINALQTQNLTSGGVYQFRLQVGKNLTTADSLLFASSDTNKKKSSKLKHFEYVTTLDAGNDTYLFLTFKLDGAENRMCWKRITGVYLRIFQSHFERMRIMSTRSIGKVHSCTALTLRNLLWRRILHRRRITINMVYLAYFCWAALD